MKNVAVLVFDGVEELEAAAPIDLLRRAGANVCVVSVSGGKEIVGRSRIKIVCDAVLGEVKDADFDAVALAGGPGTNSVAENPAAVEFIKRHFERGALVAAICAAPVVLKKAGALEGKKCTAHFSRAAELENCDETAAVVADGNVITSRGAGTAVEFGLKIAEYLFSEKIAKDVAYSICFVR